MERKNIEAQIMDLIDACNRQDIHKIQGFFSDDFLGKDITFAISSIGKKDLAQYIHDFFSAFTDMHFSVDKLLIEGKQIVVFWTAKGLHSGVILMIPPSFKRFSVQGVWFLELMDNLIWRGINMWDMSGFLRRIRLMPNLPHEKYSQSTS